MKRFFKETYFTPRLYKFGAGVIFLCAFGFAIPVLFIFGQVALLVLATLAAIDLALLYKPDTTFRAVRRHPRVLGLADDVRIELRIHYTGQLPLKAIIIDELPEQLQKRDFAINATLVNGSNRFSYAIRPGSRGVYSFGNLVIVAQTFLQMVKRKWVVPLSENVAVYPSIIHMHEMELLAFSRMSTMAGSKNLKRIGQSYEFEQILPFVEGDDYRNINWKATGKTRELMVNQFQDERSQNVYAIISKGRAMKLAFNQLNLLDYAINSSLAIANVALKKYDRVGLITFSDKIGTALRADNRHGQLQKILEALYAETERDLEPSYELLYRSITRVVQSRSLLLLFSNIGNTYMLERALPTLAKINRSHLLVMVMFRDSQLEHIAHSSQYDVASVYQQTLARKEIAEREDIAYRLRRNGIHTVVSYPEQLSVNVINKYLELKSVGLI